MSESPNKTDLEQFKAMLDCCEIRYDETHIDRHVTLSLGPDAPDADLWNDNFKPSPNLTGDSHVSANFKFSVDGRLVSVDMTD